MTASASLDDLRAFLADATTLEAATIARPGRGSPTFEARAMSLEADAEQFFRDIIARRVQDKLAQSSWILRPFDAIYKPDPDEVEYETATSLTPVVYATTMLSNMSALAPFDPDDKKYKRRLKYWSVVLTANDGTKAHFFRSFTASAELERKRGAAFINRSGSFTVVDESIFIFDDEIDCVVFDSYVYVLRKKDFRRIFDQLSAVLARAKTAATELHQRVPIANFDDFEKACSSDSRLADKLLAVRGRDYFDQLSYEMLEPVITRFHLTIPTATSNGGIQLVFEGGPSTRFQILKLVDDDYLRSAMTDHDYEVNSKSQAG